MAKLPTKLPTKHPEIVKKFSDGNFTIRKTKKVFSAIPIDQAHGQNNGYIKEMEELLA